MPIFPYRFSAILGLLLALCGLSFSVISVAQTTPTADLAAKRAPVKFDVDIDAPKSIREFLLQHVALQSFKEQGDLDALEISQLVLQMPQDIKELLATQGYFSPIIEINESNRLNINTNDYVRVITARVDPGESIKINAVDLVLNGNISTYAPAKPQSQAIESAWLILKGKTFTQDTWDSAKSEALSKLIANRYPLGRISDSRADIDTTTKSAKLSMSLDSGPLTFWSAPRPKGLQRYESNMVLDLVYLSGLREGNEYSSAQLQDSQQLIAQSGYFDSVFVYAEPKAGDGDFFEPIIQVREAKLQKIVYGIGASAENGLRLHVDHTHNKLPVLGWRALSTFNVERKDQSLTTDWMSPTDKYGWRNMASALYKRQIDDLETTTSQRVRYGFAQENKGQEKSYYLQYDRAATKLTDNAAGATETGLAANSVDFGEGLKSSLTANVGWVLRRFDNSRSPQSGYGLAVDFGVGATLGQKRAPFSRIYTRAQYFLPLNRVLENAKPATDLTASNNGRFIFRAEAGLIAAKKDTPVPDSLLFLTGGDNTVRGYGLRNIGVPQTDGSVSAGSNLVVVSAEWQRPIKFDGKPSLWESVLFVDGGAVTNNLSELKMNWGIGTGLQYKSPVGPLQASVAYGLSDKKFRFHLSVGFTF